MHGDILSGSGNKKRLAPKNIAMIRIPTFLKAANKSCFIDLQQPQKKNIINQTTPQPPLHRSGEKRINVCFAKF